MSWEYLQQVIMFTTYTARYYFQLKCINTSNKYIFIQPEKEVGLTDTTEQY
jgi:hypothetical protein